MLDPGEDQQICSDSDATAYHALKQRVHTLKKECRHAMKSQLATQEFESVALLEARLHFDALMKQGEEEVTRLQQQLRQNTERSAKLRQQHERERKALLSQTESLRAALEGIDGEHAAAAARAASEHGAEVAELRVALQQLEAARAADAEAAAADKALYVEDIDGWCTGEVDAVRHQARQQLDAAAGAAQHWQGRAEEQERLAGEASAAAAEGQALVRRLQGECEEAGACLLAVQQRCETLSRQLDQERRQTLAGAARVVEDHHAEMRGLKTQHTQQLTMIDHKVQFIVGKKDATIAALKAELQGTSGRFKKLEQLLSTGAHRLEAY